MHKLNIVDYKEKKAAKTELEKPHTAPNSIAALRVRVLLLEKLLSIKPQE